MVDGDEAVDAVPVRAHDVVRLALRQLAARTYPDPLVVPQGVQSALPLRAELGQQPLQDARGLDQGAVGPDPGAPVRRAVVRLGEQPDQRLLRQLQDLLQRPHGPQRLRALRAAGALLPVAQARDADLHAVAGQMVLDPLQRQSACGDRGPQGDVEGAAAQGRVQFRGAGVRVLCGVRHAGAFL
ncbi:hypothetical protein SGRIM128S_09251 [Streptomyces griseomycini]